MGIIIIFFLLLNALAIGLLNGFLYFSVWYIKQKYFSNKGFFKFPVLLITLPTLCLSVLGSCFIFYEFFWNGYVGIGTSFIWIPKVKYEIVLAKTSVGRVMFQEERGGWMTGGGSIRVMQKIIFSTKTSNRDMNLSRSYIYKLPEMTSFLREENTENNQMRHSGYSFFLNPDLFEPEEFYEISDALKREIDKIDDVLAKPREPVTVSPRQSGPHPKLTKVCYIDIGALKRNFTCSDGSVIQVSPSGGVRVKFARNATRKNGASLDDYPLGSIRDEGKHLKVSHSVENFSTAEKKLTMFDTVMYSCYDEQKRDFLNEYTFSQHVLAKKK